MISIDSFRQIELKVATVKSAQPHPNADKLIVLQIDLGNEQRQICAGIRNHYTPEELVAIAEKEYSWCEAEMKKAAKEMGFGDDWRKALEKVVEAYNAKGPAASIELLAVPYDAVSHGQDGRWKPSLWPNCARSSS